MAKATKIKLIGFTLPNKVGQLAAVTDLNSRREAGHQGFPRNRRGGERGVQPCREEYRQGHEGPCAPGSPDEGRRRAVHRDAEQAGPTSEGRPQARGRGSEHPFFLGHRLHRQDSHLRPCHIGRQEGHRGAGEEIGPYLCDGARTVFGAPSCPWPGPPGTTTRAVVLSRSERRRSQRRLHARFCKSGGTRSDA